MTIVSVKDLSVYTETNIPLVSHLTFSIEPSEILGLMGKSGCGKTTTAFALTRLLPTCFKIEGSVFFEGKNLLSTPNIQHIRGAKIGYILQDPFGSLHPAKKIISQIKETPYIHKIEDRHWISTLMQHLHIDHLLDRYPCELSGGQRQRVCIAIALSCRPKLLIADEPTTALDAILHKEILDLLKEIRDLYHISILFISHDKKAVNYICDRILKMENGQFVKEAALI